MEELPHLLCDPRALRDGYLEALEEYLVEVRRGCARMGIDYTLVRTERLPRRGAVASSCTTAWPCCKRVARDQPLRLSAKPQAASQGSSSC